MCHDKSINFDPDPMTIIPKSIRCLVKKFKPPKTAGKGIEYYPPEGNIHNQNMIKKNINFKKLNNAYGVRSASANVQTFEKYLNRDLGKISNSYGRLDNLKKFTQRPRTNTTTFNQIDSYEKYFALKKIENVDIKSKIRPLTNFKNKSLEKLGKSLFELQRVRTSKTKIGNFKNRSHLN